MSEDLEEVREFALQLPGERHRGLEAGASLAYSRNKEELV